MKKRNPDMFSTMNVDHIHKLGILRMRYENRIKRTDWHKILMRRSVVESPEKMVKGTDGMRNIEQKNG